MAMVHISWVLGGRLVSPRRRIDETGSELMNTYIINVHRPAASPDIAKGAGRSIVGGGGGAAGALCVSCKAAHRGVAGVHWARHINRKVGAWSNGAKRQLVARVRAKRMAAQAMLTLSVVSNVGVLC